MVSEEVKKHNKVAKKVYQICKKSGFVSGRSLKIIIPDRPEAVDLDAVAIHNEAILIFECKSGKPKNIEWDKEISNWLEIKDGIKDNIQNLKIENIAEGEINEEKLNQIRDPIVKIIFAMDRPDISDNALKSIEKKDLGFMDDDDIFVYKKTSDAIGKWTKYHILRDFKIETQESRDIRTVDAIRLIQPGNELYIFTFPPSELLRICYVHRRTRKETSGYQRVTKESRIKKISEFLNQKNATLPNNLIISWDKDSSKKVNFIPDKENGRVFTKGNLTVPLWYCSAMMIDGQHRLYGFIKTKFGDANKESEDYKKFNLLVVGIKNMGIIEQTSMFIDINWTQERIKSVLLCDLSTLKKNLKNEITWSSLLVKKLNEMEPWEGRIETYQYQRGKPSITIAGFALSTLLKYSLGFNKKTGKYSGPLFGYAPFNIEKDFSDKENREAFEKQLNILVEFFKAVKKWTSYGKKWDKPKKYAITRTTGVNALLFVLNRIFEKSIKVEDFDDCLKPLKNIKGVTNKAISKLGGGWPGYRKFADLIITHLNENNPKKYQLEKYYKG